MRRVSLDQLRQHRTRPDPDLSLGFLAKSFERDVARPHRQLGRLIEQWPALFPDDLVHQTRLESLRSGVLTVSVASPVTLYEIDRRLRTGLERQLIETHTGPAFRRIKLKVDPTPFQDPN